MNGELNFGAFPIPMFLKSCVFKWGIGSPISSVSQGNISAIFYLLLGDVRLSLKEHEYDCHVVVIRCCLRNCTRIKGKKEKKSSSTNVVKSEVTVYREVKNISVHDPSFARACLVLWLPTGLTDGNG